MSWHNWAGDQVCQPASVARPGSVSELTEVVAGTSSAKVRGSGHSFSDAALTDGVMIDLGAMDRVLDVDPA
ncbi:MAG TPA: FAD-binding protein, partial [Solirubrobacteraceae bacterium]|nr:FAD-binding protein [Solirubrobacteraceae bacterium]